MVKCFCSARAVIYASGVLRELVCAGVVVMMALSILDYIEESIHTNQLLYVWNFTILALINAIVALIHTAVVLALHYSKVCKYKWQFRIILISIAIAGLSTLVIGAVTTLLPTKDPARKDHYMEICSKAECGEHPSTKCQSLREICNKWFIDYVMGTGFSLMIIFFFYGIDFLAFYEKYRSASSTTTDNVQRDHSVDEDFQFTTGASNAVFADPVSGIKGRRQSIEALAEDSELEFDDDYLMEMDFSRRRTLPSANTFTNTDFSYPPRQREPDLPSSHSDTRLNHLASIGRQRGADSSWDYLNTKYGYSDSPRGHRSASEGHRTASEFSFSDYRDELGASPASALDNRIKPGASLDNRKKMGTSAFDLDSRQKLDASASSLGNRRKSDSAYSLDNRKKYGASASSKDNRLKPGSSLDIRKKPVASSASALDYRKEPRASFASALDIHEESDASSASELDYRNGRDASYASSWESLQVSMPRGRQRVAGTTMDYQKNVSNTMPRSRQRETSPIDYKDDDDDDDWALIPKSGIPRPILTRAERLRNLEREMQDIHEVSEGWSSNSSEK